MLRHKYKIAAVITGVSVMAMGVPAMAADAPVKVGEFNKNGAQVQIWAAEGCELPMLPEMPDNSLPETPDGGQPEAPETPEVPETPAFAMQVIELVNQERAKEGLPALVYDAGIEKAALVRAKETETSFSHTRPDGRKFSTALTEAGVEFRGAGENIAYGQRTPEEVMKGWMNSPGHRANIMNENYTKIGVGYYQNANGVNYWTQLFTY